MALYDTSNIIDNSIYLKAKLGKNMVSDNYYIENLQDRRDLDWNYRYNVVDIEEELEKQVSYTSESPSYTAIEAVITNVKGDKGEDLGSDWAHLAFQNLKHPNNIGYRYRFSLDFENNVNWTEEEKKENSSIWIAVNKSPIKAGNSCTVRRCNTFLQLVGSKNGKQENYTEVHNEPCILENDMKYMQIYYNQTLPIPQAEQYATMQLNYFSNSIKINDRFLFGTVNSDDRQNNTVFKVKAVVKSMASNTFTSTGINQIKQTPLITIALDKDTIGENDDLENRIAVQTSVYKVKETKPINVYYSQFSVDDNTRLILNESNEYEVNLYKNDTVFSGIQFTITASLEGILEKNWGNYFEFVQTGINKFTLRNIKQYSKGKLIITAQCNNPETGDVIENTCLFVLGGFY